MHGQGGAIVNVSSVGGYRASDVIGGYSVSKAALEALVKTYAHEVANTTVRVNIVNPGPIRTGMRAKAYPGEKPETLKTPEDIAPVVAFLCSDWSNWIRGANIPCDGGMYQHVLCNMNGF